MILNSLAMLVKGKLYIYTSIIIIAIVIVISKRV